MNVAFFLFFCSYIYRYYSRFGTDSWNKLTKMAYIMA